MRIWKKEWFQACVILIFYVVGIISHFFPVTLAWMKVLTPYFLFIVGILVMLPYFRVGKGIFVIWFGVTYLLTFGLEVLGVYTGKIFGAYSYGSGLGSHILGVPPIIGFNWVVIIFGLSIVIHHTISQRLLAALLTGVLAVVFDWIMEPVAIRLDYWAWSGGVIPVQNYIAWFIIAVLFSYSLYLVKIKQDRYLASYYVLIQLVFFICLRFL